MSRSESDINLYPSVTLVAYSTDLYHAWCHYFAGEPGIEIEEGDILARYADAIVSPANSFGYMDGGLDLKYSQHFGWELESRLRALLEQEHAGEIPVGSAVIVDTEHPQVPYLISAPTMRVPMDVSATVNAYLAFKAVLLAVRHFNATGESKIATVLCPGLGTGEGRLPVMDCARQMRFAWDACANDQFNKTGGLAQAVRGHMKLVGQGGLD